MKISTPYVILVAVLVGIIIFQRACHGGPAPAQIVTKIVTDTQWKVIHDTITSKPKIEKQFIAGKEVHIVDTEWLAPDNVDTARIIRNYFAVNYYPYLYTTKYGDIIILDSITQNKIRSRTIINTLKIPTITTTKTVMITQKPSLQVYVGGSLLGGKGDLLSGFGPDVLVKTKGDQIYQGGAYFGAGPTQFRVGTMWKLKFR